MRGLKRRKGEKNVVELPAKNRRVWTASFTLVDQWLDPGSPGGFRQTNGQFPKEIFCHFNIPTWRQASALLSALWVLQSCFYAWFIRNFCSVCYSVFHVCCLNLDFVVVHSDFAWLVLVFLSLNKQHLPRSRPVYHRFFYLFVCMLSFFSDMAFYYSTSIQPAIRLVSLNLIWLFKKPR